MAKFTTLSQELFDQKAQEALSKTPLRREFPLNKVEVIDSDTLNLDGTKVKMSSEAFSGICKVVGLPKGFDKTFTGAFGDKARQQLVNRLKVAAQAKGNSSVSLVVNPESKKIISVHNKPEEMVSNQTFLETSKSIIDKYSLDVSDFSIDHNGSVVISASSPRNVWGFEGLPEEDFFGGVSFTNSPEKGFQVSPYMYRLICSNGMIGTSFDENHKLNGVHPAQMEKFWESLNSLAERSFRPLTFEQKLRHAINTPASFAEMEDAHSTLKALSNAETRDLDPWVPLRETRSRYHLAGIDTTTFTHGQKKGAKTGTSVWDLINGVTHFATHDNGFAIEDYDRRRLQVKAAQLMTKDFDMANIIQSPF